MPLKWRVDVLALLKENGYSTYRIRKEKLLSESTLQHLRQEGHVSWNDLETICRITKKQPGKLIEYEDPPKRKDVSKDSDS